MYWIVSSMSHFIDSPTRMYSFSDIQYFNNIDRSLGPNSRPIPPRRTEIDISIL